MAYYKSSKKVYIWKTEDIIRNTIDCTIQRFNNGFTERSYEDITAASILRLLSATPTKPSSIETTLENGKKTHLIIYDVLSDFEAGVDEGFKDVAFRISQEKDAK